jgi:Ca2+-binding EF-hand superfamily protein
MCRYSGDILPVSEFTIDEWDCDRVCQMNPYGPKSIPKETSYTIRQDMDNKTEIVREGFNEHDAPAWRALFNQIDEDGSGSVTVSEIRHKLTRMVGPFRWDDDGDGKMDFTEFVEAMTTKLEPSTEMAIKMYAHSMLGHDLTKQTSNPTDAPPARRASVTDYTGPAAEFSDADKQALMKLFAVIDQDNSGVLEKRDIEVKMTEMLGNFSWQDDGDGTMDTHEFVGAMAHMSPSVRMTAIMYAKTIL